MKQILLFISIFILTSSCKNDKTIYLSHDYESVIKLASKNNKKVFIDFYTTWCGGCKGYDKYIFPDSTFQVYIQDKFYSLELDAESPENKEIVKKYKVFGYPTIIIADSKGNEINRIVGYYGDKPNYYIELIDNMLRGKETFESFKQEYLLYPDSIELFRNILESLVSKNDYKNITAFNSLVHANTQNNRILYEAEVYAAMSNLWDKNVNSPILLKRILSQNDSLLKYYEPAILEELCKFYKNKTDSFEYFGFRLLNKYPNSVYQNRHFAEYLFLNNRGIEKANKYASFFNTAYTDDHWAAYLMALSYANNKDIEGGASYYDSWIDKHKSIIDSDWAYFFYVKYATIYKTRIDKAIEYAYRIENGSCDKTDIRIFLAKLLHEKGENKKAIETLKEVIPMIESIKEKEEIDNMVNEFSI